MIIIACFNAFECAYAADAKTTPCYSSDLHFLGIIFVDMDGVVLSSDLQG